MKLVCLRMILHHRQLPLYQQQLPLHQQQLPQYQRQLLLYQQHPPPIPVPVREFNRDNLRRNNHIIWNNEGSVFPAKVTTSGNKLLIRKMKPVPMPGFREVTFRYDLNDLAEIPFDTVLQVIKTPKVIPESRQGPGQCRFRVPEVQPW